LKLKLIAGILLVSLSFWAIPLSAASRTEAPKFPIENKQVELAKESIIYKTNAPVDRPTEAAPLRQLLPKNSIPGNAKRLVRRDSTVRASTSGSNQGFDGRTYSKEEIQALIRSYSAQYGISASLPLRIANCESGYNQFSKNSHSTASGVFQYLSGTWKNTPAGKQGISVFDAEANVKTAVSSIAINGTAPWNASKRCWDR
jgi:hypothetical protein